MLKWKLDFPWNWCFVWYTENFHNLGLSDQYRIKENIETLKLRQFFCKKKIWIILEHNIFVTLYVRISAYAKEQQTSSIRKSIASGQIYWYQTTEQIMEEDILNYLPTVMLVRTITSHKKFPKYPNDWCCLQQKFCKFYQQKFYKF